MSRCVTIKRVDGGYIVNLPFPFASYHNGNVRVEKTWKAVLKLLEEVFQPGERDGFG